MAERLSPTTTINPPARPSQQRQMSIQFQGTDLPVPRWATTERVAVTELLQQMLLEAVLAESRVKETNNE